MVVVVVEDVVVYWFVEFFWNVVFEFDCEVGNVVLCIELVWCYDGLGGVYVDVVLVVVVVFVGWCVYW